MRYEIEDMRYKIMRLSVSLSNPVNCNLTHWRGSALSSPSGGAVERSETERALSAPYGGTSPKGRGKGGCAAKLPNYNLLIKADNLS